MKLGILCYSLTPSTVDLIERLSLECHDVNISVYPLVKTDLYSTPKFSYIKPDEKTNFLSFGKNKEENQIIKFNFIKMLSIARNSDIILSFGVQSFPCLLLSFFAKIYNRKFYIAHQTMSLYGESKKKNKFVQFLKRIAINNATKHVAQTPAARDVLATVYHIDRKNIIDAFWDGGINSLKKLPKTNTKYVEKLKDDNNNELAILFVGSIIPLKNIEVIIRAVSIIPQERKVSVNIIGHDAQYPGEEYRLKKLVDTLNLSHRISFKGRKGLNEIIDYYIKSDVVILPSIKEAWAKVLVEAAYFENALITTKVNGQAGYLVQNKITGYILDDFNDFTSLSKMLIELLDNPELLINFKRNAKNYITEFSTLEDETASYVKLIKGQL